MANLIEVVILAVDQASATMARVGAASQSMGGSLLGTGAAMVTMGAALEGVAVGVGRIAEAGAQFEYFTDQIINNTTEGGAVLEQFRQGILDLSVDTGIAYEKLGDGFLRAENISHDTSVALAELRIATESVVASGGDAAQTANVLANAMHEYGLDAARAADGTLDLAQISENAAHTMGVLHLAAAEGNMTLEEFSEASGRSIGVAANLGVGLEDVSAAFAALTLHGFDAAMAGTQMTNILTHMINPTVQARKEIERVSQASGVDLVSDFTAAGLHAKGLEGVLGDLSLAFQRMGLTQDEATQSAMKMINAQRGGLGLATLLGTGYQDYRNILKDLNDQERVNAITEEQFNDIREDAVGQWHRTQQAIRATAVVIGMEMLPAVGGLLRLITPAAEGLYHFAQAHAALIARILVVIGVVSGVVGALMLFGGALLIASATLAPVIGLLGTVATVLAGPVGIALAVATVALLAYRNNWLHVADGIQGSIGVIRAAASGLATAFATGDFNQAFGKIILAIEEAFGSGAAAKVTLFVSDALRVLQLLRDTIITIGEAWRGQWESDDSIQPVVRAIGEFVLKVRDVAIAIVDHLAPALSVLGGVFHFLIDNWQVVGLVAGVVIGIIMGWPLALVALITAVKALALAWFDNLGGIREKTAEVFGAVRDWIDGTARPALQSFASAIHDLVVPAAHELTNFFTNTVGPALREFGHWITGTALPALGNLAALVGGGLRAAWDGLAGAVGPVVAAIVAGVGEIVGIFGKLWGALDDKGAAGNLAQAGRDIAAAWQNLQPYFALLWKEFVAGAQLARAYMEEFATGAVTYLQLVGKSFELMWEVVQQQFAGFDNLGEGFVASLGLMLVAVGMFVGWMAGALPGALQTLTGAILFTTGSMRALTAMIGGMAQVIDDVMAGRFTDAFVHARQAVSGTYEGVVSANKGFNDFFAGINNGFTGGFVGAFQGGAAVASAFFNTLTTGGRLATDEWEANLRRMAGVEGVIGPFTEQMLLVAAGERAAAEQAGIMAGAVAGMGQSFSTIEQITGKTALGLRDIDSYGSAAQTRINDLANAGLSIGGAWGGWSVLTDALKQKLGDLAAAAKVAVDAISNLGSANSQLAGYYHSLEERYNVLAEKQKQGIALSSDEAAEMGTLGNALAILGGKMGDNSAAIRDNILQWLGLQQAAADTKIKIDDVNLSFSNMGSTGDAVTGFVGLTDGLGNIASAGDTATTKVNNVKTAIDKVPTTLTVAVDAPNAGPVKTAIDNIQTAINNVQKSFTVTAYVNIAPATAAINDLSNQLPHSPAKEGPLSVLPNWMALFEELPSAAAKAGAEAVSAVAQAVTAIVAAFAVLARVDVAGGTPSEGQLGWLSATTAALVGSIVAAASSFEKEGLEAANRFADSASKIGGMIEAVLKGLAALASADFAKISPTASALGWFTLLAESLVTLIAGVAQQFSEDALKQASLFADAAGKIGGMIEGTVKGLAALASANWATISPSGSAMGWFTLLVASLVSLFAQASAQFASEALAAASAFAESAGKVVGVIGPAVAGLLALTSIVSPSQAQIDLLLIAIRYIVQKFAEMATMLEAEGVAATEKFAEMVGKVVSAATGATTLFKAFAPDEKGKGGLVIPSAEGIDQLMAGIRYVVQKFQEMATMLSTEALAAVAAFADGVGKVVSAAKSGADLFKTIADTKEMPTTQVIDYLVGTIGYLITQTRAIATGIGTEGMQQAQQFATNVVAFVATMRAALEMFPLLAKLKDLPTDALWDIFGALEPALQAAKSAVNRAADILLEAQSFRDKMAEAVKLFAEGLAFGQQLPADSALAAALGESNTYVTVEGQGFGSAGGDNGQSESYGGGRVYVPERQATALPKGAGGAKTVVVGDTYHITIPVAGTVITEGQLIDKVRNGLLQRKRSISSLGLS